MPGDRLPDGRQVQKTIGRGGMGVVVRAEDNVLGAVVAIKILRLPGLRARR